MIAFGPVPSRRLGQSLGVNNIPPKHCSYSCVYCQVGPTRRQELGRRTLIDPAEVVDAVSRKVGACRAMGQAIDYVTFVPDGEPTLDLHLGEEIRGVGALDVLVAVITNGSLLALPEVRVDLAAADLVSVKVDAVEEATWRRVNRPHPDLELDRVLRGVEAFAEGFTGELLTETMLVAGVNDAAESVEAVAAFIAPLAPSRAYLAVPTRPPAESEVKPPDAAALVRAHEIFVGKVPSAELLVSPEEGTFGRTGDPVQDLLAILSVHPMREPIAARYLDEAGADPGVITELIRDRRLERVGYRGDMYLICRAGSGGAGRPGGSA